MSIKTGVKDSGVLNEKEKKKKSFKGTFGKKIFFHS